MADLVAAKYMLQSDACPIETTRHGADAKRLTTRGRGLLAASCFLFFVAIYGLTSHDEASASDEIAAFGTGISLAEHHNLIIDQLQSVHKITPLGVYGRGDHLYSKYFPGTAITTAILYSITARTNDVPYRTPNSTYNHVRLADSQVGARMALAVNAVLGAFGMAMLFLLLESLYDLPVAIVTTLLIGLTTDWWYESQLFYLEVGAGALLIGALMSAREGKPWLASTMLAASLLFRPVSIVGLPIWLYAAWKKKPAGWFSIVPLAAAALLLAIYNYERFGSPFNFGYAGEGFTTPVLTGLAELFLSPGRSLLVFSPVLLLIIVGAPLLWKTHRELALICLLAIAGAVTAAALWHSPSGGKVWGSRLVLPVIPIGGVLVAAALERARSTRMPLLVGLLALLAFWGLSIQVITVLQDPALTLQNAVASGTATVADIVWSPAKNWVALEIRSLGSWNPCNIESYVIRALWTHCGG